MAVQAGLKTGLPSLKRVSRLKALQSTHPLILTFSILHRRTGKLQAPACLPASSKLGECFHKADATDSLGIWHAQTFGSPERAFEVSAYEYHKSAMFVASNCSTLVAVGTPNLSLTSELRAVPKMRLTYTPCMQASALLLFKVLDQKPLLQSTSRMAPVDLVNSVNECFCYSVMHVGRQVVKGSHSSVSS